MGDRFGDQRVVDTPISELGFAGLGVGAAMVGLRPVIEFMTFNFAMQAIDHIINSAAKTLYMAGGEMGSPIVFRGPNGAAARVAAQHSQDYAAWYAQVPGLKVVMPYSAADAKGLLKTAIRDPNPVIFLENEILYGRSFDVPVMDDLAIPFGKARIWREGTDVTIVSFGIGMTYALEAADKLAEEGISAEVIDLRTLDYTGMDYATIGESVKKTGSVLIVEQGPRSLTLGARISDEIQERFFDYLDCPIAKVAALDVPPPVSKALEDAVIPSQAQIQAAMARAGRHAT